MTNKLSFDPGVVIVAGGTGGIGAATCKLFAAHGVPVALTYHSSEDKAQAICEEITAAQGQCDYGRVDLSVAAEVNSFMAEIRQKHGRVAHVIYAAGPQLDFHFVDKIPPQDWYRVINADINGAFHLIQSAVTTFHEQALGGNLIAVITAAVERTPTRDVMSAAPKAAIEQLIRAVAKESGRYGIRANCVAPGWIDTGLGTLALNTKMNEAGRQRILNDATPLRRFGEAEEIAWATLFLCSQQASFITGQSLAVDGGIQL